MLVLIVLIPLDIMLQSSFFYHHITTNINTLKLKLPNTSKHMIKLIFHNETRLIKGISYLQTLIKPN